MSESKPSGSSELLGEPSHRRQPTRRFVLGMLTGLGIGSATFRRALAADAVRAGDITPEMVRQAEWIAGLSLSEADRKTIVGGLTRAFRNLESLRSVKLSNDVPPALV